MSFTHTYLQRLDEDWGQLLLKNCSDPGMSFSCSSRKIVESARNVVLDSPLKVSKGRKKLDKLRFQRRDALVNREDNALEIVVPNFSEGFHDGFFEAWDFFIEFLIPYLSDAVKQRCRPKTKRQPYSTVKWYWTYRFSIQV